MKKLTTMNSESISIKLSKWGKTGTVESDGKYLYDFIIII